MKKIYRRKRIFGLKFIVVLFLISIVSVGYSVLNTKLNLSGNVTIIIGNYFVNLDLIYTKEADDRERIPITYDNRVQVQVASNEGYYMYQAECDNGYTIEGLTLGIDSYSLTQDIVIVNNKNKGDSNCKFYSKKVQASEVAYTNESHSDIKDVKAALDYLYLAMGFEDLPPKTVEAIVVAYTHDGHPEFKTVQDALDYLYDKLV